MPTQSIATTTAKQHSHTGISDAPAPPRRPLLEAWVIAGGVGTIASAAVLCMHSVTLVSSRTIGERAFGWLLVVWSMSVLVQGYLALRQSHRTDRYWQRIGALSLLAINAVFMTGSTLYAFWVLQNPLKVGVQSNAMIISAWLAHSTSGISCLARSQPCQCGLKMMEIAQRKTR